MYVFIELPLDLIDIFIFQSDRLCLNCKQMEQTVCECPCECQLDVDFCTGGLLEEENL